MQATMSLFETCSQNNVHARACVRKISGREQLDVRDCNGPSHVSNQESHASTCNAARAALKMRARHRLCLCCFRRTAVCNSIVEADCSAFPELRSIFVNNPIFEVHGNIAVYQFAPGDVGEF